MTRKRIFEIIEKSEGNDTLSSIYDFAMIIIIVISLIPLAFKEENAVFNVMDKGGQTPGRRFCSGGTMQKHRQRALWLSTSSGRFAATFPSSKQ